MDIIIISILFLSGMFIGIILGNDRLREKTKQFLERQSERQRQRQSSRVDPEGY